MLWPTAGGRDLAAAGCAGSFHDVCSPSLAPLHTPCVHTHAGTVDALLCSKEGVQNVDRMFSEVSRVLTPGGTFLLISLGDPGRRLCLLCCERYDWTVQVGGEWM